MAAGAAGAAAAMAEAIKASGAIVRVEPAVFLRLLGQTKQPLVVVARGGVLKWKNFQYLTSYKGLIFYAKSSASLNLPGDCEVIHAQGMWMPG